MAPPKAAAKRTTSGGLPWVPLTALMVGLVCAAIGISLVRLRSPLSDRLGAPPEIMSAFLDKASDEDATGIQMHDHFAVVNMGGAPWPWGWATVAVNRSVRDMPALTESVADVQRRAVVENRGKPPHEQIAIYENDIIVFLPLSHGIQGANSSHLRLVLEQKIDALPAGRETTPANLQEAYLRLLSRTHYASPLHLSFTEAAKCLGPKFHSAHAATYTIPDIPSPPLKPSAAMATSRMFKGEGGAKLMLPVLDLVNHRGNHPNAVVEMSGRGIYTDVEVPFFRLRAARDILHGEEIVWSYEEDMTPFFSTATYGYFDPNDPPKRAVLTVAEVPHIQRTVDAGCMSAGPEFQFHWKSGKLTDASIACADAVCTDPDDPALQEEFSARDGEQPEPHALRKARFIRARMLHTVAQLAKNHALQYPKRYDNASMVSDDWEKHPETQASFMPTRNWKDCIDGDPLPGYDARQDIFESVFKAEAEMRAAMFRVVAWTQRELKKLDYRLKGRE